LFSSGVLAGEVLEINAEGVLIFGRINFVGGSGEIFRTLLAESTPFALGGSRLGGEVGLGGALRFGGVEAEDGGEGGHAGEALAGGLVESVVPGLF
jgi:hypothetical protein